METGKIRFLHSGGKFLRNNWESDFAINHPRVNLGLSLTHTHHMQVIVMGIPVDCISKSVTIYMQHHIK